ncbi:MAG: tetratricopeptide repeat protein, partial [Gammaproteobacteria bacterium]|nr:tetratricopeptide repeat protein [Gammaproteobacteria bacterium]
MRKKKPLRLAFGELRLPAIIFLLVVAVSCSQQSLPQVPALRDLGFSNALEVVRQQVAESYASWEEAPLDPQRNGQLGMLLSAYGKNGSAEILYRRARELAPGEFRWTYHLAINLTESGRYEEAEALLRDALAIDPDQVEARVRLADLLLETNQLEQSIDL